MCFVGLDLPSAVLENLCYVYVHCITAAFFWSWSGMARLLLESKSELNYRPVLFCLVLSHLQTGYGQGEGGLAWLGLGDCTALHLHLLET